MPLSSLSITDLHDKAAELRRMSQTARTQDTRDALLRLAARYAQLAEARIALLHGGSEQIGAWKMLGSAPRDEIDAFLG